jgi:hypothetical protein
MPRVDSKAVRALELVGKGAKGVVGHLDHLAAAFAQKVLMRMFGQVVCRGPVSEVDVLDDAEFLERGQVAIDRRLGNVGMLQPDLGHDVLGAQVSAAVVEQNPDGRSPCISDPTAALSKLADDLIHRIDRSHTEDSIAGLRRTDVIRMPWRRRMVMRAGRV